MDEKKKPFIEMAQGYWYRIPGFNGYEFNSEGELRSFKNFNKYPFGYRIKMKRKLPEPAWEMTDNNNQRKIVSKSEIIQRLIDCSYPNYPRRFNDMDISSRNRIMENPGRRIHQRPDGFSTEYFTPVFSIRKD